jgi:hypothetical protein
MDRNGITIGEWRSCDRGSLYKILSNDAPHRECHVGNDWYQVFILSNDESFGEAEYSISAIEDDHIIKNKTLIKKFNEDLTNCTNGLL